MTDQPTKFSKEQVALLRTDLSSGVVKEREQGGRKLSYIEGWWAISEANRIFGHDGWSQELLETKCVAEKERKIGSQKKDGWGVTYNAKVRITIGSIIREGVGSGHGIDVDLGLAHESAIKEAATDAMKRALITFGNPFGLALYDKTKGMVGEAQHEGFTPDELRRQQEEREAEKAASDQLFLRSLYAKFRAVGLDENGIYTLAVVANVLVTHSDGSQSYLWEKLSEKSRAKCLETLTREYAENLNSGKNTKGEVVVKISQGDANDIAGESPSPTSNVNALRAAADGL